MNEEDFFANRDARRWQHRGRGVHRLRSGAIAPVAPGAPADGDPLELLGGAVAAFAFSPGTVHMMAAFNSVSARGISPSIALFVAVTFFGAAWTATMAATASNPPNSGAKDAPGADEKMIPDLGRALFDGIERRWVRSKQRASDRQPRQVRAAIQRLEHHGGRVEQKPSSRLNRIPLGRGASICGAPRKRDSRRDAARSSRRASPPRTARRAGRRGRVTRGGRGRASPARGARRATEEHLGSPSRTRNQRLRARSAPVPATRRPEAAPPPGRRRNTGCEAIRSSPRPEDRSRRPRGSPRWRSSSRPRPEVRRARRTARRSAGTPGFAASTSRALRRRN